MKPDESLGTISGSRGRSPSRIFTNRLPKTGGRASSRAAGAVALVVTAFVITSCAPKAETPSVRFFHAAGFSPFLGQVREACERDQHIMLQPEGSGSVEVCRKLTALGRTCDLLALADNQLVTQLLQGICSWRIDFATDELVLGVGVRAPHVEEAEHNWMGVVQQEDVRLARANENTSPIGYRTLLALKLQERLGATGLHDRFLAHGLITIDDVERLSALLKSGEVDYAMIYKSTCVAHGIRFIALDSRVNLGSPEVDYSSVQISFDRLKAGVPEKVMIRGAPAVWAFSEPDGLTHPASVDAVLKDLLGRTAALDAVGLRPFSRPKFYGPRTVYARFATVAEYGGELR